jgi:hypothetical protein
MKEPQNAMHGYHQKHNVSHEAANEQDRDKKSTSYGNTSVPLGQQVLAKKERAPP